MSADLLAVGASWLTGQLKQFAGRSITYVRRHQRYEGLTATHVSQEYTTVDQDNFATVIRLDDFLWTASDLPVDPRPGDRIEEVIGGVLQIFEVMALGDKPCWELQDSSGLLAIVHTKRVKQ